MPDESNVARLRHSLERHQHTIHFVAVKMLLEEAGTLVDSMISGEATSTKNSTQTHGPELKQSREGNQWSSG